MPNLMSSALSIYLVAAPTLQPLCEAPLIQPVMSIRPAPGTLGAIYDFAGALSVDYSCPSDSGNGAFVLIYRNPGGTVVRSRTEFQNYRRSAYTLQIARSPSGPFDTFSEAYMSTSSESARTFKDFENSVNKTMKTTCGTEPERRAFESVIQENRQQLGMPAFKSLLPQPKPQSPPPAPAPNPARAPASANQNEFHATAARCPESPGNGTLGIIKRNLAGAYLRVQLVYADNRPTRLTIAKAEKGTDSWKISTDIDYESSTSIDELTLVSKINASNQELKAEYCDTKGPAQQKWNEIFRKNRAYLGDTE